MKNIAARLQSQGFRHKLIVCTVVVSVTGALGFCISAVFRSETDRKEAVNLLNQGLDSIADGNFDKAVEQLQAADSKEKGIVYRAADSYYTTTDEHQQMIPPEQRLDRLKAIEKLIPDAYGLREKKISLLKELKRYDELEELYRNDCKLLNTEIGVYFREDQVPGEVELAELLWQRNKKAEAMKAIERPAALFPCNKEIFALANKIYTDQKQIDKLDLIRRQQLSDDDAALITETANIYGLARKSGVEKLNGLLKRHPSSVAALLIRGEHRRLLGDDAAALSDANAALALCPNLPEALSLRSEIYEGDMENYRGAIDDCTLALKSLPNDTELIERRLNAASSLENFDLALRDCDLLIKLKPDDEDQLKEKADQLRTMHRYEEADGVLDSAIAVAKRNIRLDSIRNCGDFHNPNKVHELMRCKIELKYETSDYDGAFRAISKLIEENPEAPDYELKSDILMQMNRPKEALDAINSAIKLEGSPVQGNSLISWLTSGPRTDSYRELRPGAYVKYRALILLDKRAIIYDALNNKAAARASRCERLRLMKLEADSEDTSSFLDVIALAVELNERSTAIEALETFKKAFGDPLKRPEQYLDCLDSFCGEIETSDNPALASEVMEQLAPLNSDRESVKTAQKKLLEKLQK